MHTSTPIISSSSSFLPPSPPIQGTWSSSSARRLVQGNQRHMHMHTHTHIHKLKHSRQWARAGECREVAGRDRRQGKAGQGREGRAEGKGGQGRGGGGGPRQGQARRGLTSWHIGIQAYTSATVHKHLNTRAHKALLEASCTQATSKASHTQTASKSHPVA